MPAKNHGHGLDVPARSQVKAERLLSRMRIVPTLCVGTINDQNR